MNFQRVSPIKTVLAVLILVIAGGLGVYLYKVNKGQSHTPSLQTPTQSLQPQPATRPTSSGELAIEDLYNKIQTGMTPEQVIALAGRQPDDCGSTDSVPPSVSCFWTSGTKTVSVSYGNKNAVGAKNKTGF